MNKGSSRSSISILAVAVAVAVAALLLSSLSISSPMAEATTKLQEPQEGEATTNIQEQEAAEATTKLQEPEEATVQIVYVSRPQDEDPEAFHIRTLAAVLGSEEAAKDAVLYHYRHAASGFSAKLTPSQVEKLSKQPGVLQVVPSRTISLDGPGVGTVSRMGLI